MLSEEKNEGNDNFDFTDKITFENVSFSYAGGHKKVLDNFNISFPKNKWIGIVGASGVGKTTVFDLLLKFYEIDEGNICIDGRNINNFDITSIRRNITKISQDLFLFPGSLRDNLSLVNPKIQTSEMFAVLEEVGLLDFVKGLPKELDTDIGEDGIQLSGGQKQRLCLAIGLLKESKILLLDEVTANVDDITEDEIKKNIKKIMDERNITIVSISHRLKFLDYADVIVSMGGDENLLP